MTSSTRMTVFPATGVENCVGRTSGRSPSSLRSSRYSVMSSVSTGGRTPPKRSMSPASSSASGTPRRRMPTSRTCSGSGLFLQYLMRQAGAGCAQTHGCIRNINSLHMVFPPAGRKNALPQHSDRAYESTAKRQTGTQTLCISHSRPCRSLCTHPKNFFRALF